MAKVSKVLPVAAGGMVGGFLGYWIGYAAGWSKTIDRSGGVLGRRSAFG